MDPNIDVISQSLQQLLTQFLGFLPELLASLVIFFATLFFAGVVSRGVKKTLSLRRVDLETTIAIAAITRWAVIILGTTAALSQIGFDLTAFLAGLGIVGFTIGFALQDVSKNFVAGLLLLLQQPFDLGDGIEVSGFSGTVLRVDLRATTLRTFDGRMVQIPNGDVFTSPIVNFSRAESRRVEIQLGLCYGTDLEKARTEGLNALRNIPGVMDEPLPKAVYQTLGETSIQMTFYYWVDTSKADLQDVQDSGVVKLNSAFEAAGIEISMPTHIVYSREKKA